MKSPVLFFVDGEPLRDADHPISFDSTSIQIPVLTSQLKT